MFEKAEQEYQDLKHRKSIIENDKDKIEKVIGELDAKKNETLKKTWLKVNRDFGSIFSTLLPGANAKLEPEEGKSVRAAFSSLHYDLMAANVPLGVSLTCSCLMLIDHPAGA
jgi:structural maintenance of chromosome 2